MAVEYNVQKIPDELPPGEYDVCVLNAFWTKDRSGKLDIVIDTEFLGPSVPGERNTLLRITKHPEE